MAWLANLKAQLVITEPWLSRVTRGVPGETSLTIARWSRSGRPLHVREVPGISRPTTVRRVPEKS